MQDFSKWRLVREVGIERETGEPLLFEKPLTAVPCRTTGGFYSVDHRAGGDTLFRWVDGRLAEFPLHALRDPNRQELVVSVRDDGGLLALSGSDPREVVLLGANGELRARYFESRDPGGGGAQPWPVSLAPVGENVVVGFGSPAFRKVDTAIEVAVLGPDGARRGEWRPGKGVLAHPTHLTVVPRLGFVVTDVVLHQVTLVGWDGRVVWTYGGRGRAGNDRHSLNHPVGSSLTPQGTILVVDNHNDRIVELSLEGRLLEVMETGRDECGARTGPLVGPGSAYQLAGGELLVADTGNARVVAMTRGGRVLRGIGSPALRRRHLSFPRSIQRVGPRDWLVADTNNNRVVALGTDNVVRWEIGGERSYAGTRMKWPRCARLLKGGLVLVADGGNGRLLLVDRQGRTCSELRHVTLPDGSTAELSDPHCVRETGRGSWIVVDSDLDLVAEVDPAGTARWAVGGPGSDGVLSDPHQALPGTPGTYLLADRWGLATSTLDGGMTARRNRVASAAGGEIRVGAVRSVLVTPRMTIFSDNVPPSRLVVVDHATKLASVVDRLEGAPPGAGPAVSRFGNPRWLAMSSGGRVMLSDYGTHRLVEIAPGPAPAGPAPAPAGEPGAAARQRSHPCPRPEPP